jgi:molybdate transport system substrate-binding protein
MFKSYALRTVFMCIAIVPLMLSAACGGGTNAPQMSAEAGPLQSATAAGARTELLVSAAASLTDALLEIQKKYSAVRPVKLIFNFASSGTLQQQIEQGAPADLFLSAAVKNMEALVNRQLIDPSQTVNLLTNELVVIVPAEGAPALGRLDDLTGGPVKRIAIGIPESVPAGAYAKEALVKAKLWDSLQGKLVQAKDVRQVLTYVVTGNADAGFVYKTDARTSNKVRTAFALDPASYPPVEYPGGIVKATKHPKESKEFYDYLQSAEARGIFVRYGFSLPK